MTTAYDFAALLAAVKTKLPDMAEEALKHVVVETFRWLKESAALSPTPVDDIISVLYGPAEVEVLKAVDKVDGQPG